MILSQLNRSLTGWFQYFQHSHKTTFPLLDSWIRMRLRSILRCRQGAARWRTRGLTTIPLDQCFLCGTRAVLSVRSPCFRTSILMQGDPLTGEPDAGNPPVRFGEGGGTSILPTPITPPAGPLS